MHTFKVMREHRGWKVQLGCAISVPCKSQALAIQQAQRMAAAIQQHGEQVIVIVEPSAADTASTPAAAARRRSPRLVLPTK